MGCGKIQIYQECFIEEEYEQMDEHDDIYNDRGNGGIEYRRN